MRVKMYLISDTIFGNGKSIPGAEDISVLCDENGFPYYKGGTIKGIFRENLEIYLHLIGKSDEEIKYEVERLLGIGGTHDEKTDRLVFSDFILSENVKSKVIEEIGSGNAEQVKQLFTNLRAFTALEDGISKEGSLRYARCVNRGLYSYSDINCSEEDRNLILDVLFMIKQIGSMRNRGFGNIQISEVD